MAKELSTSLLEFGVDLYKQLLAENKQGSNIVCSPFSIAAALSMTLAGARCGTAQQIERALHIGADEAHKQFSNFLSQLDGYAPGVILHVANRLYPEKTFDILEGYAALLKNSYRTTIQTVDFKSCSDEVRLQINKWVEEVTQSKICDLLPEGLLSPSTLLVLVNAVYFKGLWDQEFQERSTYKAEFHESRHKTKMTDMMHMESSFRMGRSDELKATALELPYKGESASMVIILPDEIDGLSALEETLTASSLSRLLSSMAAPTSVLLELPKFKAEQATSLKQSLSALGISDLFCCDANLSGISSVEGLKVSDAVHKAFVEVNERGTEAAAATAFMGVGCCMPTGIPFSVSHPFLFLIRTHNPDVILFVGSVREV